MAVSSLGLSRYVLISPRLRYRYVFEVEVTEVEPSEPPLSDLKDMIIIEDVIKLYFGENARRELPSVIKWPVAFY